MKIPLFPLDVVLFPGAALPLHIFEERYKEMIGECLRLETAFGVVRAQREGLAVTGCAAKILRVQRRYSDGRMDILCEGQERFEIEMLDNDRAFLQAEVDFFEDDGEPSTRSAREECAALHFEALELAGLETSVMHLDLSSPVAFQLAACLPSDLGFKQQLLSCRSDADRTAKLRDFYHAVLPGLRTGARAAKVSGGNGRVM
ncbi:LON peptidase substrate-binding domain-containing protein [Paracidobacterium acidisoli]|uniref:ATP-dependent protease La domain-containing protein n=1 Tax=Paracidobacterium acidisoli TaxID=2303751 RepID=A0A372IPY6_9BACT|nr:LON peptidase substrate-binding domain-containing protein [Paracidobacterium acidisoli]MBT9331374.1 LON peptidase substrate-binding domain-containing protein [Paracidobacterium acidisoli]